jgi:hypothetical protein
LLEMPMLLKEILIELKEMKMQFLGMQMLWLETSTKLKEGSIIFSETWMQ